MPVIFNCDFEDGTFNEFDIVSNNGLYRCYTQGEIVHSGKRAAATWVAPFYLFGKLISNAGIRLSWMNRDGCAADDPKNLPDHAFYSAWYYLTQPYATNWTAVMQWKQVSETTYERDPVVLLSLVGNGRDMYLIMDTKVGDDRQYKLGKGKSLGIHPTPIPIAQWFQLKTEYVWDRGKDGSIRVWIDDAIVFDVQGICTEFDRSFSGHPRQFVVGNYAEYSKPNSLGIYIDDVTVEA
jgi:hypothetical protein